MSSAITIRPPRTMLEVFDNLPEGALVQLFEGKLIMSPHPANTIKL